MSGIINIVVGLVLVVGGLSGKMALLGTNSGTALAALGGVGVAIGIYQQVRIHRRRHGK